MKILFFDVETTGLIITILRTLDKQPEVVQYYGMITDENGNELEAIESFFKPKKPVPLELEKKKVGPSNEFLADKPPFADGAMQIKAQIESADLCVAHNATFDRDLIDFEFKRLGIKVNWPEIVCTVEKCETIYGYRVKLGDLHEKLFDKKLVGAHDARVDVCALRDCYFKLKEDGKI